MSLLALLALLVQTPATPAPLGVFQSRGYGWIVERSEAGFKLYHQTASACWLDPDGGDLEPIFARAVPLSEDLIGLTEAGADQATVYPFEVLSALPTACGTPDTGNRAAVVAIADLMQTNYPGFAPRGLDFPARRREILSALPAAPTDDQAFVAAERLLAGLNDPHIELEADVDGEDRAMAVSEGATLDAVHTRIGDRPERGWLGNWRHGVEQTLLDGRARSGGNNRLFWGMRDRVGYLAILTMGGFDPENDQDTAALDAALEEAMEAFTDARAVVVDVSNNRGGYDSISRRIAGRFADQARVAYMKRPFGADAPWQTIQVQPSPGRRYLGPVWLLTSDVTVSAGETFTEMMRAFPNVTHAGSGTRGALSDQTPVVLANGWRFAMPMEVYATTDGKALEGRPIQPEVSLDLYPADDLDHGHARAVAALMDRLARDQAR